MAVNEFRQAHGFPLPGTPDAEFAPGQRGMHTTVAWGIDLTRDHRDEQDNVSGYCTTRESALTKLHLVNATLQHRLNHTPATPEGWRPLVLVISTEDVEALEATRFVEWVAKKGRGCTISVQVWSEWSAAHTEKRAATQSRDEALSVGLVPPAESAAGAEGAEKANSTQGRTPE